MRFKIGLSYIFEAYSELSSELRVCKHRKQQQLSKIKIPLTFAISPHCIVMPYCVCHWNIIGCKTMDDERLIVEVEKIPVISFFLWGGMHWGFLIINVNIDNPFHVGKTNHLLSNFHITILFPSSLVNQIVLKNLYSFLIISPPCFTVGLRLPFGMVYLVDLFWSETWVLKSSVQRTLFQQSWSFSTLFLVRFSLDFLFPYR